MTQLTVKEKEHWKTRICRKVDQAIENLLAKSDRHYLTRLAHEAREFSRALSALIAASGRETSMSFLRYVVVICSPESL